MALVRMTSNLQWVGTSADAPGKLPLEDIQNKTTSYQEDQIRDQYNKFLIYDTPNINRLSFGRATDQPFIIRGIQRNDGDVQFYGPGGRTSPQNMLVRGGLVAFAARIAEDTLRMSKFMLSPKGLIWNLKQAGLQSSNPNVELSAISSIRPTKVFDPISLISNVATAGEGIHSARHGIPGQRGRYEDIQKTKLQEDAQGVVLNRLAKLKVEMFGDGAPLATNQETSTDLFSNIVQGISNFIEPLRSAVTAFDGSEIKELTGPGGPKSLYGIGYTPIRRVVSTGTVLKEQGGPHLGKAFWGIHYAPGSNYISDSTPGKPRTLESDSNSGNSIEKTYTKGSNYEENIELLQSKDAETGGDALKVAENKFGGIFADPDKHGNYIDVEGPSGPVLTPNNDGVEEIPRPMIDPLTRQVGHDFEGSTEGVGPARATILDGTPNSVSNPFPIGEKYLESNSPAQNKSREEGVNDNPGGGRFVGSSPDGSEETQQRAWDRFR